jgi:hypothetical protein
MRLVLIVAAVFCIAADSQAGPIRRLIANRQAAASGGCSSASSSAQSASACSSASMQATTAASGCSSVSVVRGTFGPGGEIVLPPYNEGDTMVYTGGVWKLVPVKK